MTAKFDAFKAALDALCIEHGVTLEAHGYDEADIYVEDAEDGQPPVVLCDGTRGTAEEQEAARLQRAQEEREREEEWRRRHEEQVLARAKDNAAMQARMQQIGWYAALQEQIDAEAVEQRKQTMRISTDPADPAYVDARQRKVWCNEVEIAGWAVADEFRRCVITADGKVLHGSVLIERLPDVPAPAESAEPAAEPAPKQSAKRRR